MKSLLFTSLFFLLLAFSSCKKDACVAGNLDTNIIGNWQVKLLGQDKGEVTFHANGTLDDPNNSLIAGTYGGQIINVKSFEVVSNESFTIEAKNESGTTSLQENFGIISYTCDEIVFENIVDAFTMIRK